MKRIRKLWTLLVLGMVPATASAVEITVRGPIGSVDPKAATLTLSSTPNSRTVALAPNATITVNGAPARLEAIPAGGDALIVAEKDAAGNLLATRIEVRSVRPARTSQGAGAAPGEAGADAAPVPNTVDTLGSILTGFVVRVDQATGTLTVRTATADHRVVVGTAPVLMGSRPVPLTELRAGDTVRVQRAQPEGSAAMLPERVFVTSAPRENGVDLAASVRGSRQQTRTGKGNTRPSAKGKTPAAGKPNATGSVTPAPRIDVPVARPQTAPSTPVTGAPPAPAGAVPVAPGAVPPVAVDPVTGAPIAVPTTVVPVPVPGAPTTVVTPGGTVAVPVPGAPTTVVTPGSPVAVPVPGVPATGVVPGAPATVPATGVPGVVPVAPGVVPGAGVPGAVAPGRVPVTVPGAVAPVVVPGAVPGAVPGVGVPGAVPPLGVPGRGIPVTPGGGLTPQAQPLRAAPPGGAAGTIQPIPGAVTPVVPGGVFPQPAPTGLRRPVPTVRPGVRPRPAPPRTPARTPR